MSREVSASNRTEVRLDPEPFIREFLRLIDEGWEPDLEEYLHRIPPGVRDQVFQRLDEEMEQRNEASWDAIAGHAGGEPESGDADSEDQRLPGTLPESPATLPPRRREPQPLGFRSAEPAPVEEPDVPVPAPAELALDVELVDDTAPETDPEDEPAPAEPPRADAELTLFPIADDALAGEQEEHAAPAPEPQLSAWPSLGGYRIESELGRGTLGDSYVAWDEAGRRKVVLKFLFPDCSEKVASRVLRESEKVASLDTFGLLPIEGQIGSVLVSPYLEGERLDTVDAGVEPLLAIAQRLAAAHEGGVLHLDLRPSNIVVTEDGSPVLLDVGIGAAVLSVPASSAWLGGLPHYESPEHANRLNLSPKSDVFSFGTLLYRVLTGELPFPGGAADKIRERIAQAEPTPLRVHDESISPELQDICLSCFARKPADRPTMSEVAEDLQRFLDGRPVRLRPRYYRDVLRKRVREVIGEVRGWRAQGLAREAETERLESICHALLAREEQWTHDPSRAPRLTRVLPLGTLLFAVACGLIVRFGYPFVSPLAFILPLCGTGILLVAGLVAAARNERALAAPLLAGGLLAMLPALVGLFQGLGVLTGSAVFVAGLSWLQLAVAAGAVFLCATGLLAWRREPVYALATCVAFVAAYVGAAGVFGFLGVGAAALFPLSLLLLAARQFEVHERFDWARPYFWAGIAALVGVPLFLAISAEEPLWAALGGAAFLLAASLFRRSSSASIRTTGRWLGAVAPGIVVVALCLHAGISLAPLDWVFALGATLVLIAHGAVLNNRSTFGWGLAGLLCAAAMPALFGQVTPWIHASILGGLGLLATAAIALRTLRSREP